MTASSLANRSALASHSARAVVWVLAFFPWIDFALRSTGARVHWPSVVGRAWDEVFLAAGLAWVVCSCHRKTWLRPALPRALVASLAVFAGVAVLSTAVIPVPLEIGVDALRVTFQPMLFGLLGMFVFADPERRDEFVDLVTASGVAIAGLGVVQYVGGFESPRWSDKPWAEQVRVASIFANPNALGAYLAMVLVLVLPGALGTAARCRRRACVAILAAALVLTFSRGAWIGVAGAVLFFLLVGQARRRLLITLASLVLVALLAVPGEIAERVGALFAPEYYRQSAHSGRIAFWSQAFESISRRPLLGTGIGLFGGSVALRHGVPGAIWVDNHYLKLGAEIGLVGLASFLAFLAALLSAAVRLHRRAAGEHARQIALGIGGAILVVVLQSMTASILEALYVGVLFYTLAGGLFAAPEAPPTPQGDHR